MKDFLTVLVLVLAVLTTLGMFFLPIILSIVIGNWWLMFLFLISWIPTLAFMTLWSMIIVGIAEWK